MRQRSFPARHVTLACSPVRTGPPTTFDDKVFESLINKYIQETDKHYERTNFREALKTGFFDLQTARDNYRVAVGTQANMNRELVLRFVEVQALLIAPICPHFAQYLWKLIGKHGVIQKAKWPTPGVVDELVLKQNDYLQETVHVFRLRKEGYLKPKKAKKGEAVAVIPSPTKAIIQVIKSYPQWIQKMLGLLHPIFAKVAPGQAPDKKDVQAVLNSDPQLKLIMKQAMAFTDVVKEEFVKVGMAALDLKTPFDEKALLEENLEFIKKSLGLSEAIVQYAEEDESSNNKPGNPHIIFS